MAARKPVHCLHDLLYSLVELRCLPGQSGGLLRQLARPLGNGRRASFFNFDAPETTEPAPLSSLLVPDLS
mgnify:CR=1 FL=1